MPSHNRKNKLNSYAKYTTIAIQMAVIITLGVLGGYKLDIFFNLKLPVFTLIFSVISVGIAVYLAIRDIIRYNK